VRGLKLARAQAKRSRMQFKAGAVLMRGRHVVCAGYNRRYTAPPYLTTPSGRPYRNSIHAELGAVLHIPPWEDPTKLKMFLYVQTLGGNLTKSYPCSLCWEVLLDRGIREVHVQATPKRYQRIRSRTCWKMTPYDISVPEEARLIVHESENKAP